MDYYHNFITEKSWSLLQQLRREYRFILIGGWAVFLYTKSLKSKDIDLVLDYKELEKMRNMFEVIKNARLKKYEARSEQVEIDIYTPYYSNPGLPAEDLEKFSTLIEGFTTVEKEGLAILKEKALMERVNSVKGRKDLVDLLSLIRLEDFNWKRYQKLVRDYGLKEHSVFARQVLQQTRTVEELELNVHSMARLKRKLLHLL